MSNCAASDYAGVDSDDGSFHLIDPETGLTVVRRRVAGEAAQDAAEGEPQTESQMSVFSRSNWSVVATTQQDDEGGLAQRPSTAPQPSLSAYSPSFSAFRGLESTSPSHAEQTAEEAATEALCEVVPPAPSRRTRDGDSSSNDHDGQNNENGPRPSVLYAFAEAPPQLTHAGNSEKVSASATASSRDKVQAQNSVLRAQLAEADRNGAQYMRLHEQAKEELQNIHQTLSLLIHGGNNENEVNERLGGRNADAWQEQELTTGPQPFFGRPTCLQQLLRVMGLESILPVSNYRRNGWRANRRQKRQTLAVEVAAASAEWRHHFSSAKWHARNGRAALAMEFTLLAISADGFDAWRSLLVHEANWNRLGGSDRQRWYCLVAAKLSELLDRRGGALTARLGEQNGAVRLAGEEALNGEGGSDRHAQQQEEQQQAAPTDRWEQLTPDLLASFLRRMSWNYAEEKTASALSRAARNAETPSTEACLPSHEDIGAALEGLLSASIAAFPSSAALFYLLASLRAIQGREEESLQLLREMMRIDPLHLLREGCICNR
ncbi:uncharacterized protein Tco025E_06468 [Trypanosoma conorhini]|uniref:Uncharacterized protein n=1 Tax=Trypanosoma conorhini TaxID=83891 RepID=A0A3R7RTD6_9TRYP|nr:uncharacterized protein Tco025E_06468 [Trypanosoma conorhini]RNF12515.1 hypothetical protein Tco025E_06468 [Trypanosoma conorhini]